VKSSDWARREGISYKTAWRWYNNGTLPVTTKRTASGRIHVELGENACQGYTLYARVSSNDQKNDGIEQLERLKRDVSAWGGKVEKEILEIGSGLNPGRRKIRKLLSNPGI
jgi:predicted site-specific integrase-resolvase